MDACLGKLGRERAVCIHLFIFIFRERGRGRAFWVNYLYPCHHLIQGGVEKTGILPSISCPKSGSSPFFLPKQNGQLTWTRAQKQTLPHIINMVSGISHRGINAKSTPRIHRAMVVVIRTCLTKKKH